MAYKVKLISNKFISGIWTASFEPTLDSVFAENVNSEQGTHFCLKIHCIPGYLSSACSTHKILFMAHWMREK